MIRKTVEFATPGTRLSVAHRQLVVERPDCPKATLPIEDLGVVIVDDVRATYTQAVFVELLDAGATVMVTGRDHLPVGMTAAIRSGLLRPHGIGFSVANRETAAIRSGLPSAAAISESVANRETAAIRSTSRHLTTC